MTPVTDASLQPLPYTLPPDQGSDVEARYTANLAGSVLSPLPADIRGKLCEMLFLDSVEGLSSFFRACHALNHIWRREFLERYTECIERHVDSFDSFEGRRIVVGRIGGGSALPQPIIDLLGTCMFDCDLRNPRSKRLVDGSPPRLLCKELVIYNERYGKAHGIIHSWIDATYPRLTSFCKQLSTMVWGETQPCYQELSSICPPFLESLDISSVDITDALLGECVKKCRQLAHLKLVYCPKISFSGMPVWESLTSLEAIGCFGLWRDTGLKNIARCCPHLTSLRIWHPFGTVERIAITADGLAALADGCPRLIDFKLYTCSGIDGSSLWVLAEKCPSLRYIELEGERLPTLHDCVMLLLAFPGISRLDVRRKDDPASIGLQTSIKHHLDHMSQKQIIDLAWACAVLGLLDSWFIDIDALIKQAYENAAHLSDEEITKMHGICVRFGEEIASHCFLPPPDAGIMLYEQASPEGRQTAREMAGEALVEFLAALRESME